MERFAELVFDWFAVIATHSVQSRWLIHSLIPNTR